jgi:hypothetical protein
VTGDASYRLDVSDTNLVPYTGPRILSGDFLLAPGQSFSRSSILTLDPFLTSLGGPATYEVVASQSLDFYHNNDLLTGGTYTTDSG